MRVGIIGFGGAGRAHYTFFSCIEGCRVVKIFDPNPAGLERARAVAPGAEACNSLEDFFRDLDAVSVCTPDGTHADYLVAALARGLHALCEKPLTDSVEGIRRILVAQQKSRSVVAVLHQMRFVPLHARMHEALRAGTLGNLSYLEGYYVHDLTHRAFVHDDWRRAENATPMVYAGCHFFDLLRWLAADEIVEVYAQANHLAFPEYPESDLNVALLRFAGGAIGKVLVTFGSAGPQDHSVRLYGSNGSIDNNVLFRRGDPHTTLLHEPALIQRKLLPDPNPRNGRSWLRQFRENVGPWGLHQLFKRLDILSRRPGNEYGPKYYPTRLYEHGLACLTAVEEFVTAVRGGAPPTCTVESSARAVLACLAGVESYRSGRPVSVKRLETVL
jgi:UDP-N-acetyl-2-amino-2-deoxyglucuronate dehydrogenase